MSKPYDIRARAFLFACEVVVLCRPLLTSGSVGRELARQLLRAGTSIGANLEEAEAAQSKPDFRSKVAISRKEARETCYWLRLIAFADAALQARVDPLVAEASELVAILTAIIKNAESDPGRGVRDIK